jgi:K+-sensing histidine kinase KdpD
MVEHRNKLWYNEFRTVSRRDKRWGTMAQEMQSHSQAILEHEEPERSLSGMSALERHILLLRFLALLLVLVLHLFDRSTSGVLVPVPEMALLLLAYNGLIYLLAHYVRWLRQPLNYLALDTVIATLAVYLTGGYHSSFYVLYVFITIGAAFQLELARTLIVTLAIGLIYVGACYFSPASLGYPLPQYILAAKVLLLLVVAVLCGLLLEQLRREHTETERERALAQRLRALNSLFQTLNTTLDLHLTLQTVAEAPKALLGAEWTTITLLDETGEYLSIVAGAGVEVASLAGQRWPVDDSIIAAILSSDRPRQVNDLHQHLPGLSAALEAQQISPAVASMINIPLSLDDEPLGLLDVAYSKRQAFTTEDLAFLQALGHEAALAIRNARLYERERQQVARLRTLDELQRGFVSAVSHELRTPLTCIKTSVELLDALGHDPADDQVELVRTIKHHVARLEAFVTELLESTKLEAGQITLSRQPTDLASLVERAVEALRPLSDRRGQAVQVQLPEIVSPVHVDRRRIEQVLINILSNAIRYTPKQGRILIQISDTTDSLRVCVTDNGPGIPDEDQAHVFEKFYVVSNDPGLSRLGLGLYIAREMIELHGGCIWVESQLGEGSTFCFQVPRATEVWQS